MTATTGARIRFREPAQLWRRVDASLIAVVCAMAGFGVLMVYSATHRALEAEGSDPWHYAKRQLLFVGIGLVVMALVAALDHRVIRDWAGQLYIGAMGALVLLLAVGTEVNGARSWFQLPGFQLQPAEFTKAVLIVAVAAYIASHRTKELSLDGFVSGLALGAVPVLLILVQPDLGTALVHIAIVMGMFLVGGARIRHIAVITAAGVTAVAVVLSLGLLPDSQEDRLTAFFDDNASERLRYNGEQAEIAIGAGGLTGKGFGEGTQTRLDFVPEQHTDFIFTAVGEELGFVGAAALLAGYAFILWRLWRIGMVAREAFGTLVCLGAFTMILFSVFQNIGMSVGIMPITGIPLPLMSHGGSSTIALFAVFGLVLNINARRFA